jgi:hypothetical protein
MPKAGVKPEGRSGRIIALLHPLICSRPATEESTTRKQLILLPLFFGYFLFAIFCPKIACQASKPPNFSPHSNIRVAC